MVYKNQWTNVSLEDRFWRNVDKHGPVVNKALGPCWIWKGAKVNGEYGSIRVNGNTSLAHRVAWLLKTGKWPNPQALHKCDNRACVRFSHLFEGNNKDNVEDKMKKGRWGAPRNIPKGEDVSTSILTGKIVSKIRGLYASGKYRQKDLAKKFGVCQQNISFVVRKVTWV